MHYIGIDPGLTGAIAILNIDKRVLFCHDLPITTVPKGSKDKPILNANLLYKLLMKFSPCKIAVEKVHAMPGQGVTSTFNFGKSYGIILASIDIAESEYLAVTPQAWKKMQGLIGTDKEAAVALAIKKYPEAASSLTRKKDHGRADALLICDYLIETTSSSNSHTEP